jgi:CRP/FNR family transcriptional regulator, cyclic AMP receptor protein
MTLTTQSRSAFADKAFVAGPSFDVEAFAARHGGVAFSVAKAGTLLFAQGERADCMFYLQRGQVQITAISAQGKEAILGVLRPGDFCGEGCLLGPRPRTATATCIASSVVARLERGNVLQAIRSDAAVAEFFVTVALQSSVRLRESLISQLFDSSEIRLARILLLLAGYGTPGCEPAVIRNIDQEALAQMVGTTRSRVNYFMNKFRKLGYIDYDSAIFVYAGLQDFVLQEDRSALTDRTRASA